MVTPIKGKLEDLRQLQKAKAREDTRRVKAQQAAQEQSKKALASGSTSTGFTQDDIALFRQTVRSVTPLRAANRYERQARDFGNNDYFRAKRRQAEGAAAIDAHKPAAPARARGQTHAGAASTGRRRTELPDGAYVQQADSVDLIRKLLSGQWPVAATLDLHGANSAQAADRFDRFIHSCLAHRVRCICIVHGKGYGSVQGTAVLKEQVLAWLKNMDAVLAFAPAPENMGGAGAQVVLLKTPEVA
ncbi:MAG TPA: Smr/MutS family protein [Advenella sp.]|nr:Smr/MutS family protein [Advenella sp.]